MNIFEDISIVILEKNEKFDFGLPVWEDIVLQRIDNNTFKILKDRTGGFLGTLLKKVI